ncbi:UNVERIFIED_CONTAM: hypothetical protein Sradi_4342700 [Sesamum radiatum]|uniref:Uncharacterized protein n=1 Tax=Sesamum radiatum TaxID=300843 RepID=A0AAW2NRC1_SESRA
MGAFIRDFPPSLCKTPQNQNPNLISNSSISFYSCIPQKGKRREWRAGFHCLKFSWIPHVLRVRHHCGYRKLSILRRTPVPFPLRLSFHCSRLLQRPLLLTLLLPHEMRVMWIETLPAVVQARILSFLAYDHQRFCRRDLCKLARVMLSEGKGLDFWVKKAAQRLLDMVSMSNYQWLSHFNLDTEEENVEDEFYSMPDWLRDAAQDSDSVFTWLPLSSDELSETVPLTASGGNEDDISIDVEESKQEV